MIKKWIGEALATGVEIAKIFAKNDYFSKLQGRVVPIFVSLFIVFKGEVLISISPLYFIDLYFDYFA
jgi:hypothetical protein